MIKLKLLEAFDKIKIDTVDITNGTSLVDGLGMDSQELIELHCAIESVFGITIQSDLILEAQTFQNLIDILSIHLSSCNDTSQTVQEENNQKQIGYEGWLERKMIINRPAQEVYKALHCLTKWVTYLPHVKKIEVLYDDGLYQEFIMHVLSTDDSILKVRSVRKIDASNQIRYFQPEPPKFLKHHAGEWEINVITSEQTELIARHFWNLNNDEDSITSCTLGITHDRVEKILGDHALFAMENWKSILEGGVYQ